MEHIQNCDGMQDWKLKLFFSCLIPERQVFHLLSEWQKAWEVFIVRWWWDSIRPLHPIHGMQYDWGRYDFNCDNEGGQYRELGQHFALDPWQHPWRAQSLKLEWSRAKVTLTDTLKWIWLYSGNDRLVLQRERILDPEIIHDDGHSFH
jgi:hypothetical protein